MMAAFMEKYRVTKKEYENMPCALISLMMLDAPKVMYGKKLSEMSDEEKLAMIEANKNIKGEKYSMADILNRHKNGK